MENETITVFMVFDTFTGLLVTEDLFSSSDSAFSFIESALSFIESGRYAVQVTTMERN